MALLTPDLSYSPQQTEVLINRNALSYVSEVSIEGERAVLDMLLIPRGVYDRPGEDYPPEN